MKKLALIFFATLSLTACVEDSAEQKQREQTDQLQADAEARIGMPRVTNFTEKRLANMIVELRDRPNLSTYTYTIDMNGGAHCLGKSIGFGLPYTTQITNPLKNEWNASDGYIGTTAQAEPNGLYSSDSTDATWVLLVDEDGNANPTYVESDITVSIKPLRTAVSQC